MRFLGSVFASQRLQIKSNRSIENVTKPLGQPILSSMEVPGRRKEIGSDVAGSVYEGTGGGPIACIAARLKAV